MTILQPSVHRRQNAIAVETVKVLRVCSMPKYYSRSPATLAAHDNNMPVLPCCQVPETYFGGSSPSRDWPAAGKVVSVQRARSAPVVLLSCRVWTEHQAPNWGARTAAGHLVNLTRIVL